MSIAIDKRIIPLTGLPRSGSTILMSILNQNTSFTVSPDSDLPDLLIKIKAWSAERIKKSQIPHNFFQKYVLNFCRSGAESWVNDNCHTDFLVDKNRKWIQQYQFMFMVFPKTKFILTMRDLRFVVNSFLKSQNNTFCINFQDYYSDIKEDMMFARIKDILNIWFLKESLVSIKELVDLAPNCREQIFIFRHEELINNPHELMGRLYNFLELPIYEHDFNNIKQIEPHYDNMYMPYGDHQIQSKLATKLPNTLSHLPQKYADWIVEEYRWYYEKFYPEVFNNELQLRKSVVL